MKLRSYELTSETLGTSLVSWVKTPKEKAIEDPSRRQATKNRKKGSLIGFSTFDLKLNPNWYFERFKWLHFFGCYVCKLRQRFCKIEAAFLAGLSLSLRFELAKTLWRSSVPCFELLANLFLRWVSSKDYWSSIDWTRWYRILKIKLGVYGRRAAAFLSEFQTPENWF